MKLACKAFALRGEKFTGGKITKDRLTLLHCVNMAGKRERLFVIGKSQHKFGTAIYPLRGDQTKGLA